MFPKVCVARWSYPPIFALTPRKPVSLSGTILVADEGSYVSYIEGCSAPVRDSYQLHAAGSGSHHHKDAEVKYSTVQNLVPGRQQYGRHSELCDQAGVVRRGKQQDVVDPVGNRFGDYLEIPELYPAR
ncbi:Iron-sulfur cluster assembly protein SufB [Salmonella enterica subsp. enterica]|uniref:Iron-sulfur cluster assembly protein SufB n=1 Tax=Salmonella enterica I TaxID=59201 RepID=A0A379WVG8_SALET|nr:Iron-sulfur cluster assembly protein SufB [Salmonella enterica subsp. enterica]